MGKGKHISEDEIRYIVSAETSKAQQEIHTLTKATSALKKEERERRKAMIELEAQGKKNTDEYRNLSKECKEFTQQISANNRKIEEMRKKLDINAMSMNQLKKQAKDLRTQLDNMSQALNPQEYAALEQQLRKVNERMGDLKNGAKNIAEIAKSEGTISVMMGNLFTKVAEWAGNTLGKMKDIALEGIEMAASADGVTKAFRAMDDGTMLGKLRKATKDTVTDLDLMKAAVQAKDFRIPLEDLGKYLQFAQLKAQQTGQSVDFMTQSIVTGLGRKSVMILDNLGLSAAEINEEMAKTGDFMSAVAAIVDKQLAAAGDNYVSAADRAMQKSVEFKNAQQELGETLLPLKERWDDVYGGMEIGTMQLIGWLVKHRASLVTLITAITAYRVAANLATTELYKNSTATKASILLDKLKVLWLNNTKGATLLYAAAKARLTGNITRADAAMKLFNTTCKASTIGLIVSIIATAGAAFIAFSGKISAADKAIHDFNKNLRVQKEGINHVFEELKKTNPKTEERTRLVKQLNDTYPNLIKNYNLEKANLKEITRAQNEANIALTNRIATEMKTEAMNEYMTKNIEKQMYYTDLLNGKMKAFMGGGVFNTLSDAMGAYLSDSSKTFDDFIGIFGKYIKVTVEEKRTLQSNFEDLRRHQKNMVKGTNEIDKAFEPYLKNLKGASGALEVLSDEELKRQVEATSKMKKLEEERQHVQDTWFEKDDEQKMRKNRELERLDNEIKKLRELGTVKANVNAQKNEDKQSKAEDKELIEAEKKVIADLKSLREQRLSEEEQTTTASLNAYRILLQNKKMSQEQYEIWEAAHNNTSADKRLSIEEDFAAKAENLNLTHNELKETIIKESNERVEKAEQQSFDTRLKVEQTYQNNLDAMQKMVVQTQVSPEARLKAEYTIQMGLLESYYKASLEYAKAEGKSEQEITAIYNKAKLSLDNKYQQDKLELVKNTESAIRGLQGNSISQEFTTIFNSIENLKGALEHIGEEDFWSNFGKDILQNMQIIVNTVTNGLSSAFNTFKQIEIDNVEAKYDAEIEAAQGNKDKVEQLEQEKAQKKLDIEKKYADVQFAVKASQIIANTALAIMMALGQLGPIAGPIAAALMGATGAIQLAAANAERNKVKNMTLSGGSSSSNGSGQRVATGREDGGKIDVRRAQDGKLFEDASYEPDVRGFIDKPTVIVGEGPVGHSREWVASNAAVENPTVGPIIDMIDKSQQAGTIRTLDLNQAIRSKMAGFSSGGSISSSPSGSSSSSTQLDSILPAPLMMKFINAIISLDENGVASSVALTEIEQKQQLRDKARSIGSKF